MCTKLINQGLIKTFVKPLFIFWIIFFIRFGAKRYEQIIGIPIETNCAPLVADLFLFCYERDFMKSLSQENQADIIEAFNSTSRYLDGVLNIDNIYFEHMIDRIYPYEPICSYYSNPQGLFAITFQYSCPLIPFRYCIEGH